MPELHVAVRQSGFVLVERTEHPRTVRLLPDRRLGVVYRKLVYPLHERDYIDLSDETYDPTDCPAAPDNLWIAIPFFVELGEGKSFLAWDGPVAEFDHLSRILREMYDIRMSNLKPSVRPASDGMRYAHYARIWNPSRRLSLDSKYAAH
jgi:hypothetical protein